MSVSSPVQLDRPVVNRSNRRLRFRVALPQRPRFIQELAVVQIKDKMLVDGADQLHVFEGKAAQGLLTALIPLMDGTRTVEDLENALPEVPAAEIAETIASLFELRLVEDESGTRIPEELPNPETLAFFRRYAGATGVNRNGLEAWEKLRNSKVLVLSSSGTHEQAEALKSVLLMTGIGEVSALSSELLGLWRPSPYRQSLIVSLSLGTEDFEVCAKLDEWCAGHQASWLRAVFDTKANSAELGPIFNSGQNGCYRCFCRMHSQPAPDTASDEAVNISVSQVKLFLSMVALEVTCQLSHIGIPLRGREFQRYALPAWKPEGLHWLRIPGCPRCLPIPDLAASAQGIDTAYVFESYCGHEYRPIASQQAHDEAARKGRQISQLFPRFLNCTEYKLNGQLRRLECGALDVASVPVSGRPVTCDDLATILMMTAGIRSLQRKENKLKRWAATGGNLGSVQLFVAVRDVAGLKPGLYLYQPSEHSLASFERRSGALEITHFMERVVGHDAGKLPEAMMLLIGGFGRLSKKYGAFGYRLVNLDAGAAVSQLQMVAGSMGIGHQLATRWADDFITDQLNLDEIQEQATAVVSLFRNRVGSNSFPMRETCGDLSPAKAPEEFRGASLPAIFEMLFHESRIAERELSRSPYTVPPEFLSGFRCSGPALPLPPPMRGGHTVDNVLAGRSSVRHYTAAPVRMDQLSTMLHFAIQGDRNDWPQEYDAERGLRLLALAWKVQGVEPGVYEYNDEDHSMTASSASATANNAIELFVQSEFAAAPLVVWVAGNLAASCAAYGAFGHRQLLLRAGATAHRLSMAALATGLGGTIVAGVVPGAARRLLALDGYRKASLVAFAAGYPFKPFGLNPSLDATAADSAIAP